ncbi:MAG: hydrogenase maturation nickel metallochaperone HypA [Eggerthellaceae bacterium]|jgi:hydrogenase nickel incorporation protein HypA/HybF
MHELGLMTGIMDAVLKTAENAGADKVTEIKLTVGEMTEVVEEAMVFAFEALSEGTMCEGAKLDLTIVHPRSRCLECGAEYDHDRFHVRCPECDSPFTELLQGREMQIDSIEIYNEDDPDEDGGSSPDDSAERAPRGGDDGRAAGFAPDMDDAVDKVAKRMADHILEGSE